jgi:hypothetical protein
VNVFQLKLRGEKFDNNNNDNNNKWNVKTKVILVTIGATGTISKSFIKYVSNTPGNHKVKELQKTSHIGHCTHTSESANVEIQWSQRRI